MEKLTIKLEVKRSYYIPLSIYGHEFHFLEAAIVVDAVSENITQATSFSKCSNGVCEWNQMLTIPVNLAKDIEVIFKFRGKSNAFIEEAESTKNLQINRIQHSTDKKSPLLVTFSGVCMAYQNILHPPSSKYN